MDEQGLKSVVMKKQWVYWVYVGLLLLVAFIAYRHGSENERVEVVVQKVKITQKQIDSLKATLKPLEKKVVVYKDRYRYLKDKEQFIVYDTVACQEIVQNLKDQLAVCDTVVVLQDSIIYVDREVQKRQEFIIEKKVLAKPKPFGVGVQVGYGIDAKPYVGVGVSYNLIRF